VNLKLVTDSQDSERVELFRRASTRVTWEKRNAAPHGRVCILRAPV
jgi:hypothetical protein